VVKQPASAGSAPEFVDEARRQLLQSYGDKGLLDAHDGKHYDFFTLCPKCAFLGISIKTTCDARVERLAREALEHNLEALDDRQGFRKPLFHTRSTSPQAIKSLLVERSLRRLHAMVERPTKAQRE